MLAMPMLQKYKTDHRHNNTAQKRMLKRHLQLGSPCSTCGPTNATWADRKWTKIKTPWSKKCASIIPRSGFNIASSKWVTWDYVSLRIARKLLLQGIVPKPPNKNKGPVLTILSNQSQLHPTSIGSTKESAFCKKGTASVSCEACTINIARARASRITKHQKCTSIRST